MPPSRRGRSCELCSSNGLQCDGTSPCQQCRQLGEEGQCRFKGGVRMAIPRKRKADRASVVAQKDSRSREDGRHSSTSPLAPIPTPSPHGQRLAMQGIFDDPLAWQSEGGASDRQVATVTGNTEKTVHGASTDSSSALAAALQEPSTFPVLRYFGRTAIAPGLRCVEVELRDSDEAGVTGRSNANAASESSLNDRLLLYTSVSNATPSDAGSLTDESALFEPDNPSMPTLDTLHHLVPLFFEHLACHFPFLSESRVKSDMECGTLEALEANCICALASRFSSSGLKTTTAPTTAPGEVGISPGTTATSVKKETRMAYLLAEPFATKAKSLVLPLFSLPSISVCQALVLLTWAEWGSDRDASAWLWSGLAIRMSQDLGLYFSDTIDTLHDDEHRRIYRLTFWSVYFLDRIISYGSGRKVTIAESDIEIAIPTSEECFRSKIVEQGSGLPNHPWPSLLELLRHRGLISDALNRREQTLQVSLEQTHQSLQQMMAFVRALPADLRFNVDNLQSLLRLRLAPILVIMHCLFHSIICILHRPSLLQNAALAQSTSAAPSLLVEALSDVERGKAECSSSACSIADILTFSTLLDPQTLLCNPYMDHGIYLGANALLFELNEFGGAPQILQAGGHIQPKSNSWRTGELIDRYRTMRDALHLLSGYWGGIRWVCDWIEHRAVEISARTGLDLTRESGARSNINTSVRYKAAPATITLDLIKRLAKLKASRVADNRARQGDAPEAGEHFSMLHDIGDYLSDLDHDAITWMISQWPDLQDLMQQP